MHYPTAARDSNVESLLANVLGSQHWQKQRECVSQRPACCILAAVCTHNPLETLLLVSGYSISRHQRAAPENVLPGSQ